MTNTGKKIGYVIGIAVIALLLVVAIVAYFLKPGGKSDPQSRTELPFKPFCHPRRRAARPPFPWAANLPATAKFLKAPIRLGHRHVGFADRHLK